MKPLRAALAAAVVALLLASAPASPAATPPTVRLSHAGDLVTAYRWPGEGLSLAAGAYVEAVGGTFELHASADGTVRQIVRDASGTPTVARTFAYAARDLAAGLNAFFLLDVRTEDGKPAGRARLPFCPASREVARVDDSGPAEPTLPPSCYATPITKATVWGIDAGWAMAAPSVYDLPLDLADGTYDVTISIAPRWVRDLAIPAGGTTAQFQLAVTTLDDDLFGETTNAKGITGDEPAGGVPDLVSLPAWQIGVHRDEQTGADVVAFAATVWNAGTGPLVVEGFRGTRSRTMTAFQYFYRDGAPVSRARAGSFEFHAVTGHNHWHFTDFARYSLLDRTTGATVRSEKESFCLTWTDPIDLTIAGAAWSPGATSLQTACGAPGAIWIRQALPVGWGDTYHQTLPGQSFDVTDLPNGRYAIEVAANTEGRLVDLRTDNDIAVREITLGGTRGARTVTMLGPGPDA